MSDPLPDPSALPDHGVLSEPPLPSSDDMERTFRRFAGAALALAGSFCLWFALSTKLEADAEHAVTATWSPIAVKLYQELPAADSESERAEVALRGPLLPIRVDDGREIAFELYEGEDPAQKLKAFCQHYMGADATSCIKQMTPHVNV